jgi:hypothetical protein
MRRLLSPLVLVMIVGLGASRASADPALLCERIEDGLISVDGLRQDWQPLKATPLGAGQVVVGDKDTWNVADVAATVKCGYDDKAVFLLAEVTDDDLVRTARAGDQEDRLELVFDAGDGKTLSTLRIHGASATQKGKYQWVGKPGGAAKALKVAIVRLEKGYAVELRLGAGAAPGVVVGSPLFRMTLRLVDVDGKPAAQPKTVLATGGSTLADLGTVEFDAARQTFAKFLQDKGLSSGNVLLNEVGQFVTGAATERLVIAGNFIALMGEDVSRGGGYFAMPVPLTGKQADVLRFRTIDLDGNGTKEIMVVVRQQGTQGLVRDILFVLRYQDKGGFDALLAHEVAKRQPGNELINVYATVPRKPRGFELEMKVGTNTGWTKDNFHPTGGERLEGILVPWEGSQEKVFLFSESGVTEKVLPVKGARPAPRRAPPRRRR